jgi:putative PIN family toxin of toxin-antitoxin system
MPNPMQVVIDTNVFIAGLRSKFGASHEILRLLPNQKWESNISIPLLLEYEEVAHRERLALNLDAKEIEKSLKAISAYSNHRVTHFKWPVTKDRDDEMVIEVAISARCEYIITFNTRDFARAREFGIRVVTPGEFLDRVKDT